MHSPSFLHTQHNTTHSDCTHNHHNHVSFFCMYITWELQYCIVFLLHCFFCTLCSVWMGCQAGSVLVIIKLYSNSTHTDTHIYIHIYIYNMNIPIFFSLQIKTNIRKIWRIGENTIKATEVWDKWYGCEPCEAIQVPTTSGRVGVQYTSNANVAPPFMPLENIWKKKKSLNLMFQFYFIFSMKIVQSVLFQLLQCTLW